ncbi:unnamed protein product, partial [Prorocentrum cordatum]
VQRTAHAAHLDGLVHPEIQLLAALGTWGEYPGNVHHELMTKFGDSPLPEPYQFEIPAWDSKTASAQQKVCAALLPHEWFASLFKHHRDEFDEIFAIDKLPTFWQNTS